MDRDLIEQKLLSLSRCLERVASRRIASAAELKKDFDAQDIVSLNLQRAVGFRNISVHEYDEIDWELVYDVITRRLGDFRAFALSVRAIQ